MSACCSYVDENSVMQIGAHRLEVPVILAPMAGVTDRPFRQLCRSLGAGLCVSEMTTADPTLWQTEKSRLRRDHTGEPGPIAVQIAGYDPAMLAEAARFNVAHGAEIIDINLGCPAKKVCRVDAGSALMRNPDLVERICAAVAAAVPVPVTLKMRSGYSAAQRNAVEIAMRAEQAGIAAVTVHGRTRDQHYQGEAEYDTVTEVRRRVQIPVIISGDIDSPQKARTVLDRTGCDAVMVGRAAQGRPWILGDIAHYLRTGNRRPPPTQAQIGEWLLAHLDALYRFYGEARGLRVARKHIQWYCQDALQAATFWPSIQAVSDASMQRALVHRFFQSPVAQAAA